MPIKDYIKKIIKIITDFFANHGSVTISLLALIISGAVFLLTVSPYGIVKPLEPTGYALIRGERDYSNINGDPIFPSDLLILDIEWVNTKGQSILIREPQLLLTPINTLDSNKTDLIIFEMAGEYDDLKSAAFFNEFSRKKSIILEPHTISIHRMVFHKEKWHDKNEPKAYWFRFFGNESFKVQILYDQISPGLPIANKREIIDPEQKMLKERFEIYPYVDTLVTKNGDWYTYHYF